MTSTPEEQIAALVSEHGSVPPPWAIFPDEHPYRITWRMGEGESHMTLWYQWWEQQDLPEQERIEYFRSWSPPARWLEWVISALWEVDDPEEIDHGDYFEQLEALGFGSQNDFEEDFDDPKWLQTN